MSRRRKGATLVGWRNSRRHFRVIGGDLPARLRFPRLLGGNRQLRQFLLKGFGDVVLEPLALPCGRAAVAFTRGTSNSGRDSVQPCLVLDRTGFSRKLQGRDGIPSYSPSGFCLSALHSSTRNPVTSPRSVIKTAKGLDEHSSTSIRVGRPVTFPSRTGTPWPSIA